MCGIVGYIGDDEAAPILLESLKRLEYRGYDSAGVVTLKNNDFNLSRSVGKLSNLINQVEKNPIKGRLGIGHTRWATHGGVTHKNTHPHVALGRVGIVHNGIIENYEEIKNRLSNKGYKFLSDTDSEVLAHLFVEALEKKLSPVESIKKVLSQIKGAFAFAIIAKDFSDTIMVARNASPLVIGIENKNCFVASDAQALAHITKNVIYLKDGNFALIRKGNVELFDSVGKSIPFKSHTISSSPALIDKAGYRHFMEKEIYEQPDAISYTISSMSDEDGGLSGNLSNDELKSIKRIVIIAAGTSFYAGLIGRYWIEKMCNLNVSVEIASEYRYRNPSVDGFSTAIAITQSGESLDTLMALRHASENGLKTIAIVNVLESTIAREVDFILPTRAGPEIGVASTKSFTSQLIVLLSLAVSLGKIRGILKDKDLLEIKEKILSLPRTIGETLNLFEEIKVIANKVSQSNSCLFLGRGVLYPIALEAALKLKELSYIHAEGFAAGEMKHGPIALIEKNLPVICFLDDNEISIKTSSNLREAEARGAKIIVITTKKSKKLVEFAHHVICVPDCSDIFSPIIFAIPAQILAYLTASEKGTDIDQPRNLAKSVTVE